MRFELRSNEEDALNKFSHSKEQQRRTLRSHPSYQARTKHNGVGVTPSDFPLGLDKKFPGNQDKHAARSFLFSRERKMGREGRVITQRQKGQAYSGLSVVSARKRRTPRGTPLPKEKGVGLFGRRKSPERQILRKTWCRDDGGVQTGDICIVSS